METPHGLKINMGSAGSYNTMELLMSLIASMQKLFYQVHKQRQIKSSATPWFMVDGRRI
jgi:hypothetical protein